MTKENYQFVGGDFRKLDISGELLPKRWAEREAAIATAQPAPGIAIRGEDLCFLAEAATRMERIGKASVEKFDFSRAISAHQASAILGTVAGWFSDGRHLLNVPDTGLFWKVEDGVSNYGLDVATSENLEEMAPWPVIGGKVAAEPFLAAYRNLRKLEGHFGDVGDGTISPVTPATKYIWSENWTPSFGTATTTTTTYQAEAVRNDDGFRGYMAAHGPNVTTRTRWIPSGAKDHAFTGLAIMPLTVYVVSARIYTMDTSGETGVVIDERNWSGLVVYASGWSQSPAYISKFYSPLADYAKILSGCCGAIEAPWSEISADVSGIGNNQTTLRAAYAQAVRQMWVATVDDVITAALTTN